MIDVYHDNGKNFILNFAPVSPDPLEEVNTLAEILSDSGIGNLDALELNASCPNVVMENGKRHDLLSYHPELLGRVLLELSDISANLLSIGTMMVRISPFKDNMNFVLLAEELAEGGVDVVTAFNTFPGGHPKNSLGEDILEAGDGIGGRSGIGMSKIAEVLTDKLIGARNALDGRFEVIGSNGVGDAETMKRRLDLGCVAVSATTIFWESNNWGEAATTLLRDYAELIEE